MPTRLDELDAVNGLSQVAPNTPGSIPSGVVPAGAMPGGLELQGVTLGRGAPSMRFGQPPQPKQPQSTEMERERGKMSSAALRFVDDFSRQLGVDESKGTVKHPELLAYSRDLAHPLVQEYIQKPKTRQLYNTLDSAFFEAAIVLTGRQGDVQKLQQLRDTYRFGGLVKKDPGTITRRLRNLKSLIQTFDDPNVTNTKISQQMDQLITEGQSQLDADESDIVQRLLGQ